MGFDDLPGGQIGAADVPDFALVDEIVERAESFFDRSQRIGRVKLV